ncbi:hypothetical protein BgiMline_033576 [Biomphalaria glabrata]|nr:hypothetical protein BgiMline_024664 [Biomphalaria glabrata]
MPRLLELEFGDTDEDIDLNTCHNVKVHLNLDKDHVEAHLNLDKDHVEAHLNLDKDHVEAHLNLDKDHVEVHLNLDKDHVDVDDVEEAHSSMEVDDVEEAHSSMEVDDVEEAHSSMDEDDAEPLVNRPPALTSLALTRVTSNSKDYQRTTISIQNSEGRPVTAVFDRNVIPCGATGFTPHETIHYGSTPKEKQSQERQPKTTHEVASQQAENAPELDDLGGAVASGGGATLSDQKSERPRGKIKLPEKCTAPNGKLCQSTVCKGKTFVLCKCEAKPNRNDLDNCPDCGYKIAK